MLSLEPYSSLSLEEREIATRFMVTIFGTGFKVEDWAQIDWILRIFEDGQLVSHLTITERTCDVGGCPVRVGGIGGVATLPGYRRRGYASLAMRRSADFMRYDLGVDFGLLFCGYAMESFYSNLGWRRIYAPVYYDQPNRKQLDDGILMYLPCVKQKWLEGVVDVCGLPW